MTDKRRAHICPAPDCNTLTISLYCWSHAWMQPQADWAIAQSVSNDLQDEQEQAQQDHDDKVQT